MLSDLQSRKIAKYRKLAKKNKICRYLATFLIITNVIVVKFFSFHKRTFMVLGELCLITCAFFLNTSFAPPVFGMITVDTPQIVDYAESAVYTDSQIADVVVDEHDDVDTKEGAGVDDLIEKSVDSGLADPAELAEETDMLAGAVVEMKEHTAEETDVVFNKNDWNLLLINKQHTIPEDYQFTLGTIKGSMRCDERIIEPLTQMFVAAQEDGINLVVRSPYRDMERQEYLFERKVKYYQSIGMSYMDAYKQASITVTVPGASEHQVGLAVDITSDTYAALEIGFADTDAGKWLEEHSWEYGFILRYPLGKEEVTGIQFEPWHFRYVGVDAARVIMSQNITLEEFIENL